MGFGHKLKELVLLRISLCFLYCSDQSATFAIQLGLLKCSCAFWKTEMTRYIHPKAEVVLGNVCENIKKKFSFQE